MNPESKFKLYPISDCYQTKPESQIVKQKLVLVTNWENSECSFMAAVYSKATEIVCFAKLQRCEHVMQQLRCQLGYLYSMLECLDSNTSSTVISSLLLVCFSDSWVPVLGVGSWIECLVLGSDLAWPLLAVRSILGGGK